MDAVHITDLEAAINHWRELQPCQGAGHALHPATQALASAYAHMICQGAQWLPWGQMPAPAQRAWLAWFETQPDTPCIAICSTSQGDDVCKGCGRSFAEVQHWPGMSAPAKRAVWLRITQEASSWRFTRYAERATPVKPPLFSNSGKK